MSTVLVDANVLIDALRGHAAALGALSTASLRGDDLWSSTVVRVEILGAMRAGEEAATEALLEQLDWLPVTREIADAAAAYARRYRASHSGIDLADYLLAATADHLGASVLTRNVRDFPMFEGLRPAY